METITSAGASQLGSEGWSLSAVQTALPLRLIINNYRESDLITRERLLWADLTGQNHWPELGHQTSLLLEMGQGASNARVEV